ncbi:iron-containing alcohol dehydrogenase [Alishewanella sp. 16-MA]|uniref:Iron-containing alcohol dehydrogenase n=1 Tax=Alishewanella maricola TaxID=2795740 RepID=A0ABS8C3T2_9ALTE|nr:iron-containing alcohol dehydrogenase [Alishewanella maricola]MCB5226954.1 iron-containing alcohol dehydrogenase [Alishewanella maricola]
MLNFNFKNQTEILFGKGQIKEAKSRLPQDAKVLFLYGGGSIKRNGVYDDVIALLDGVNFHEFAGVEPNPTLETLMQAVELVRAKNINFILAVGGGSVIDGAKFIAAAAHFKGEPWDILAKGAAFAQALPIGAVLTLPATGSESNGNSVVTNKATAQKRAFASDLVQPTFAVLDPVYTLSLPVKQVSNGVVDAFVHVIEQYLTYPVNAPLQDRFAEGILQTLISEGPKALATPDDYDVRANVMWSATMALNGLIGKGVPQDWATHMIGHELTALFGLDHAQTLAVVLPTLMYVQREKKRQKLLQFGRRVFNINTSSEDEVIDLTIKATQDFFENMGVKTRLSDYNLAEADIDKLVANLERNGMTALGEHGDIDLAKARQILTLAL